MMSVCYKIGRSDAEKTLITALGGNAHGVVRTDFGFGCVHFEEKERGPFAVVENGAHLTLTHEGVAGPTLMSDWGIAQSWRDWLNDLWAEREQKEGGNVARREFCHTCAHTKQCVHYSFGSLPCCEWSPK